jgi:hypothetical protein
LVIINTPKKHPEEAERRVDPIDSSRDHIKTKEIVELLIPIGGSRYFSYTIVINIQEVHPACKRGGLLLL